MLTYKVGAKYAKGPEKLIAKFDQVNEAKEYIQAKLEKDAALRVSITYLLYDMGELMESFAQGDQGGASSSGGGQSQASAQNFRPSPLQTAPRPPGVPPSSFKDEKDDSKSK